MSLNCCNFSRRIIILHILSRRAGYSATAGLSCCNLVLAGSVVNFSVIKFVLRRYIYIQYVNVEIVACMLFALLTCILM